jgi:cytochrome c oxidase subunit 2
MRHFLCGLKLEIPAMNQRGAISGAHAAMSHGWDWMPANGSRHGFVLDHLMNGDLVLLLGLLLLAHLLLLWGPLRRRKADHGSVSAAHSRKIFTVEIAALCALCLVYAWMTLDAQRLWATDRYTGPSPAALQVEVVGTQFHWYFRYPGQDAAFGHTKPELADPAGGNPLGIDPADAAGHDDFVSSVLVLPAGREVDLTLRSQDVIHGFFIPGMRLKQDAVPGLVLHLHFTPVSAGVFPIVCSQLCGMGHEHMQASLRVVSPAEYTAWLAGRERAAAAASAAAGAGQ